MTDSEKIQGLEKKMAELEACVKDWEQIFLDMALKLATLDSFCRGRNLRLEDCDLAAQIDEVKAQLDSLCAEKVVA